MRINRRLDSAVLMTSVIGSLILVNLLAIDVFDRLDLTRDRQFTLADATKSMLNSLDDPIVVRAYFTSDLPTPYSDYARHARDLLEEYYNEAEGNFKYEIIDPAEEETAEDKITKQAFERDVFGNVVRDATSVEKELQAVGIPPVQVQVNADDKVEIKRVYMGISVKYREKSDVIPIVQNTGGLEYELTTLMRRVIRERAPKVALYAGKGANGEEQIGRLWTVLRRLYEPTTTHLTSIESLEDVDALIIPGPKKPLSEEEMEVIDAFVMSGRSVAFLLDSIKAQMKSISFERADHGLSDMLKAYGVTVGTGLVLDTECATITVRERRGGQYIQQPVPYPYLPIANDLDPNHPLSRGLTKVAFPFMSPLEVNLPEVSAVKWEVLAESSRHSWVQEPPYNLDPKQRWSLDSVGAQKNHALLVTLNGPIRSYFQKPGGDVKAENARVLVAGGAGFLTDQFLSPINETLALNILDWLLLDEQLLAVRSRGLAAGPLADLDDVSRNAVRYANIVGLPLLLVGMGLIRWRRRESRRRKVHL